MPTPRAVVIPFGVPAEGRGLGLGLAALVHSFAQIQGQSVALAQRLARQPDEGSAPGPVEAFIPPQAWRDLAGNGNAPGDVSVVVTGTFEPPGEGRGHMHLLVYDARDGTKCAQTEAHVDVARAGATLLVAFDEIWKQLGGELGVVRDVADLGWDALESVLRAERCALHDPMRGGPYDRLAAMVHLGRAVSDAPDAKFPAGRLAAFALDAAMSVPADAKLADASLRALTRAAEDAPDQVDLIEAAAALDLRLGDPDAAEGRVNTAIEREPKRARLYALLSEARRSRGDLPGALDAVHAGLARAEADPLLCTEKGVVLAEQGDIPGAALAWRDVLTRRPLYPAAFANLASLAVKNSDVSTAQQLVDQALSADGVHPEVLRRAIQLALATEGEGMPRASRVAKLALSLIERAPDDAWASLMLARSLAQTGDKLSAARRLAHVETIAPESAMAAEARRGRFALQDPQGALELDAVLRAAYTASPADLEAIASRAKKLAELHCVWPAWFAVGIAERRRERWSHARSAFEAALALSAGCTPAHMELVAVFVAVEDGESALRHARKACALEGESARTLAVLATALLCAGMQQEATVAIDRALELDATDEAHRALASRIRSGGGARTGPIRRIREVLSRWRKR